MRERHHASGLEAAAPESATSLVIEPPLDLPSLTLEETRIGLHLEGVTTRVEAFGAALGASSLLAHDLFERIQEPA